MTAGKRVQARPPAEGLTRAMARAVAETPAESVPAEVREQAKVVLLDWTACTLAGADHPAAEKLLRYADRLGGRRQAALVGRAGRRSVTQAALINGTASHVVDFDDTSTVAINHASAGMLAALVAVADWQHVRGAAFITAHCLASAMGDLIGARVGIPQYEAGWHTTATIGPIAAAAGCARLLGLDAERTAAALGLAGTMSAGLKIVFGSMTKSFHAGNACRAGVMAALLGAEGFTCAGDFYEGPEGYLQVHGRVTPGEAEPFTGFDPSWGFGHLAQKYHASCHFTHAAIEAARAVVANERIATADIRLVELHVSRLALRAAGKTAPRDGLEAKFSLPYCVANALLHADTGLAAFADGRVHDAGVRAFMERVRMVPDDACAPMAARVRLQTAAGQWHEAAADVFRDIPPLAARRERIAAKFLAVASPLLGERRSRRVMSSILGLEEQPDVGALVRMLRLPAGRTRTL
jgi:2-methylcitrate dehydratase PrpD